MDLQQNTFIKLVKKKQAGFQRIKWKEKPLESLLSHQGEKPRGPPQDGIKYQKKMQEQAWVQSFTTFFNFVTQVFIVLTLIDIYI